VLVERAKGVEKPIEEAATGSAAQVQPDLICWHAAKASCFDPGVTINPASIQHFRQRDAG